LVGDAFWVDGYFKFDGKDKKPHNGQYDQTEPIKWLTIRGVGDFFV